jgi:hypothetical protein
MLITGNPDGIAEVGAEQAAVELAVVLQAAGIGRIHAGRRDAAKGRASADGHHVPALVRRSA